MNILVATNLLESMKTYLQETRDKFSEYEFKARSICPDTHYSDEKNGKENKVCVLLDMMDHYLQKWHYSVKANSSR